jgi:hypothetical protein
MTNDEIKKALFSAAPVRFNGIEYQRVYEIVYRRPENKVIVSAGLLDRFENCIVYAPVEKVEAVENNG